MKRSILLAAAALSFSFSLQAVADSPPSVGPVSADDVKIQKNLRGFAASDAAGFKRVVVSLDVPETRGQNRRTRVRGAQDRVLGSFAAENSGLGLGLLRRYEVVGGFSAELTARQIRALSKRSDVAYIEEIPVHYKVSAESHPLTSVDLAQNAGYTGDGTVIAIIDDGIDHNHAAFGGQSSFPNSKIIGGFDFSDFDNDPTNDCAAQSHGTAVAGVAAGNGGGITGVAPDAKLVFLKIQSSFICGQNALDGDVVGAIDWAVANKDTYGIDIISMSFGSGAYSNVSSCDNSSSAYYNAVQAAEDAGITLLAASGNDGLCNAMSRPACFSNVISVGAVYDESFGSVGFCVSNASCATKSPHPGCAAGSQAAFETAFADNVIVYSNSASFLDLTAPSTCATTAQANGGTNSCFGGTSSSTPFSAGVAALVTEANGNGVVDNDGMRAVLTGTGDSVTDPKNGRISPRVNALAAVGGSVVPPPSCTATSVHVSAISVGQQGLRRQRTGTATVSVVDDCGDPAGSYTVSGSFTGEVSGSDSAVTSSAGRRRPDVEHDLERQSELPVLRKLGCGSPCVQQRGQYGDLRVAIDLATERRRPGGNAGSLSFAPGPERRPRDIQARGRFHWRQTCCNVRAWISSRLRHAYRRDRDRQQSPGRHQRHRRGTARRAADQVRDGQGGGHAGRGSFPVYADVLSR